MSVGVSVVVIVYGLGMLQLHLFSPDAETHTRA